MGTKVTLEAADGFRLGAYRADPAGPARGGVVVIQEIFGVNQHIRSVCDRLADVGYRAIAPQLFDRIEPNFESGYTVPEVTYARELTGKADWAKMVLDTSAAIEALKHDGPVAVMGFCMGGSVAFLAATRFGGLAAAICYYGGQIARNADRKPKCPVQMHFGEDDDHISMSDVETIRQKRPECEIHIYPGAGHAFSNEDRSNYELRSAKIAWQRSLALLSRVFTSAKSKQLTAVAAASRTEVTPSVPPEAVKLEVKKPEIKKPKVKKPVEAQKPEVTEAKKPEAKPAMKKPAAKKPEIKKAEARKPVAPAEPAKLPVKPKPAAAKKPPIEAVKPSAKKAETAKKEKPRKAPAKKSAPKSSKVQPKPKLKSRPKPKRKVRLAAKPIKKVKARRKPTRKTKSQPRKKLRRKQKPKSKPVVRRKISAQPKPKARPRPKSAPRPKQRVAKRKPAPRIARPKPKPKPRPKLKPKPRPKSRPKPKPKPAAQPEKRRSLWGFGLFSSPYYRRGRF